jgi:hypothetical protein
MSSPKTVVPVLVLAAMGSTGAFFSTSAQALVLPPRWTGGISCMITTNGPYSYHDQQTQSWTLCFNGAHSENGTTATYADQWSETGSGSKNGVRWTINGHANGGGIAFRTDAQGHLIIAMVSSALRDPLGITVTDASHSYSAPAYEWPFPAISVAAGQTDVMSPPVPVPVNGSVGFEEPGGSLSTALCSWHFQYGSITLGGFPRHQP